MIVNKLADTVWEIKNFLSEEEVKDLNEMARGATEEEWIASGSRLEPHEADRVGATLCIDCIDRYRSRSFEIDAEIAKKVESIFTSYEIDYGIYGTIIRANRVFVPLGTHRDNESEDDKDHMYAVLIYLNDDFVGGELEYPELGITYKPVPGSAIVHYAGNLHGVEKVRSGDRYTMAGHIVGLNTTLNLDNLS